MRAAALGTVIEVGPGSSFTVGDPVTGIFGKIMFSLVTLTSQVLVKGMTEYTVIKDKAATKLEYVFVSINLSRISLNSPSVSPRVYRRWTF